MNLTSIYHEPKSKYAYAYDKKTLHLRIKTAKGDVDSVKVMAVDPFNWVLKSEDPIKYEFDFESIQRSEMKKDYSNSDYDFWFAEIKIDSLRIKYAFVLQKDDEKILYGPYAKETYIEGVENKGQINNYFNFPFINEEDIYKAPDWIKDTIWYQIFPERFAKSNNNSKLKWDSTKKTSNADFFGGDLQGIIEHLDYLQELGVTGIYFTPIFESPSSHKYDTTDYFKIDPSFGTNEIFKELVKQAHNRNIKVMLDAVFNHCGFYHNFWQDIIKNGRNSEYYECFHILNDPVINFELNEHGGPTRLTEAQQKALNYRTFAFAPYMPKWNTNNEKARKYLLDVAKYWIEEYDIDGWRLDVSNEVSHDFWRAFRKTVKSIKEDVYILGENWDNSYPWLQGDQFDAVMNYEFAYPIWDFIGNVKSKGKQLTSQEFVYSINSLLTNYPKNVTENMFNMIDSHDTSRFLSICDENVEKAKLGYVLQMTFSGAPSIYYGSEVGLVGEGDDCRRCMAWDKEQQNLDLKEHIVKLINIRKTIQATKSVDIKWLDINNESNYIVFKKTSSKDTLYVFINNSEEDITISLNNELKNIILKDVYNNNDIVLKEQINISANGFLLLVNSK